MRQAGLRIFGALFLSILALAGVERRVPGPPSDINACAVGEAPPHRSAGSLVSNEEPSRQAFRNATASLRLAVRGTGSLLRLPLRTGDTQPPAFTHDLFAVPLSRATGERHVVPVFARFLAAARDGTLSSRSTGLPPPLA